MTTKPSRPMPNGVINTWRDLTDQLTPKQVEQLTNAGHMPDADLLAVARDFISHNALQTAFAGVAPPAGTASTSAWYFDGEDTTRTLYGRQWRVGNATVCVIGEQSSTGAAAWAIEFREVEGTLGDITSGQARELATLLAQAAEELDRLTADAQTRRGVGGD